MKPAITLFHKEFRQHGAFALAMVIMCLLFQVAAHESSRWLGDPVSPEMYLFVALVVTALYAGAAAALAYSTEHADNTYTFLRKLPISTTTLALGKIGWVLCGTALVLLCNCLLAAVWSGGILDEQIAVAFGISILEMFVWGLFWSTRCRSQVHAILAGLVCASLSAWLIANLFSPTASAPVGFYLAVVPHRLAFIAVMACFALWGALRWFEFDAQTQSPERTLRRFRIYRYGLCERFLRYPQKIQSPFLALVHQHIRHASILYPLGIAAFVVFALGYLYNGFTGNFAVLGFIEAWGGTDTVILMGMMLLFWGNIFGHDQKNDSYRFLSRLGIHEGKIWWSRILPALILYVPVIVCFIGYVLAYDLLYNGYDWQWRSIQLQTFLAIWLAPVAMGAFFSISFRSQMVAIALTIGGTFALLGWMAIFFMLFGSSPLWTTVPIAIALLIASRLRAKYWLRETYSWRSRLIPLVPFFVVMLAIPVVLPFVRIYTIPYVSWEQIDSYFDQADLPAKRNPVKRKALLQYIAAHGTVPEEYETVITDLINRGEPMTIPEGCTYEEYMLLNYAWYQLVWNRAFARQIPEGMDMDEVKKSPDYFFEYIFTSMLWEKSRVERVTRVQLVAALVNSAGGHLDKHALALTDFARKIQYSSAAFDSIGSIVSFDRLDARISAPLHRAHRAIAKWYKEHGTLPESLDVLEGTFVHPFTDEPVRYYVNSPPLQDLSEYIPIFYEIGGDYGDYIRADGEMREAFKRHGGTYLVLGKRIYVLIENENDE